MEELFMAFSNSLDGLIFWICVYILVGGIINLIIRSHRNKIGEKIKINKKNLIFEEITSNMLWNFISVLFFIIGIFFIVLFSQKAVNIQGSIVEIIFGLIFIIIPLIIFYKKIRYVINMKKGNFAVVRDVLKDKKRYDNSTVGDENRMIVYKFFFNDYFTKYNEEVIVQSKYEYKDAKINDEYYLIFVKGEKQPSIYNLKRSEITEEIEEKIVSIDELGEFIEVKELDIYNEETFEKQKITPKKLIKEVFNKNEKRTLATDIFISIFLISILVFIVPNIKQGENVWIKIFVGILVAFFIFITISKIKYLVSVISNIKHDEYKIIEDEVISINDKLDFEDKNYIMKFKLKKYKKILYADRKDFYNTQVGDIFYLIFVKSEKEPIKFYNKRNVNIDL